MLRLKWLTVPQSTRTTQVAVAQLWEVRWKSRYGEYAGNTRPEMEAFTSEDEARAFADALRKAYALIRYTGDDVKITLKKAASI